MGDGHDDDGENEVCGVVIEKVSGVV